MPLSVTIQPRHFMFKINFGKRINFFKLIHDSKRDSNPGYQNVENQSGIVKVRLVAKGASEYQTYVKMTIIFNVNLSKQDHLRVIFQDRDSLNSTITVFYFERSQPKIKTQPWRISVLISKTTKGQFTCTTGPLVGLGLRCPGHEKR